MEDSKRTRTKDVGFVGVNLVRGGDTTLLDRLEKNIVEDPEMDRSKIIRVALKEYFDNQDKKNNG